MTSTMGMLLAVALGVAAMAAAAASGQGPAKDERGAPTGGPAGGPASQPKAAHPWVEMTRFFSPPQEYKDRLGSYRSAMTFDDGSPVKAVADWPRRRREILACWHDVMGPWPALLDKPRIEYQAAEHVEGFTRHRVKIEVAAGKFASDQYLLVPDGDGPFPAVLVTWYNSADSAGLTAKQRGRVDFGYELTRRGFVTLCIGNTGAGDVRNPQRKQTAIQPLSFLAYTAANCCNALSNLPQVDPARIGVVGHSFGGKWAMFSSCLYERFACAVWVDPGIVWNEKDPNANYWDKWYLGYQFDKPATQQRQEGLDPKNPQASRAGAYKTLVEQGHDLHELHALMAPRPFLVSGGAQDRPEHWTALNHAIALNRFLGQSGRVAMTMRDGHSPTAVSNAQVRVFFEHFLKEEPDQ